MGLIVVFIHDWSIRLIVVYKFCLTFLNYIWYPTLKMRLPEKAHIARRPHSWEFHRPFPQFIGMQNHGFQRDSIYIQVHTTKASIQEIEMTPYPLLVARFSRGQRIRLWATFCAMFMILTIGYLMDRQGNRKGDVDIHVGMTLKEIAPKLDVTPKALARELGLPLETPKKKPLKALGIQPEALEQSATHLLSHHGGMLKYFIFGALVLGGLMFLTDLGRPADDSLSRIREWYPRSIHIVFLTISVCLAGFALGKSPNPMEGVVKVFKSMAGLYPDPFIKVMAFLFFIALAVIGNKLICGWACPFGALQELIYSIPLLKKIKRKKLPFLFTNTIRVLLFVAMLLVLFGLAGGRKGMVLYHYINPFNLFDLKIEAFSILMTIVLSLAVSFIIYRPFCHFVCPFGLVSWIVERVSLFRVRIDKNACTGCGACIRACPTSAAGDRVANKSLPADCFSCARCLNVCPVDAIGYKCEFGKQEKP